MSRRMRVLAAAAGTITVTGLVVAPYGAPAFAGEVDPCSIAHEHQSAFTDFNGDGKADLAIGVPGAKVEGHPGAGAVEVRYGFSNDPFDGGGQSLALGLPRDGDHLGAAVATGDLNGDYCTDVIAGIPNHTTSGHRHSGAVAVFLGTSTGLPDAADQIFAINQANVIGQANERFGASITLTPGETPQSSRVAIGVPLRDRGEAADSGAVAVMTMSGAGSSVSVTDGELLTQDTAGVSDLAQDGDHFGTSLAFYPAGLAVGVPNESFQGARHAGGVNLIYDNGSPNRLVNQDSPNVAGTAEKGDHFGAALSADDTRLVVGIPDEDQTAKRVDTGKVEIFEYSEALGIVRLGTAEEVSQANAEVPDKPERGDHFGASVAVAPDDELLIGVPGEDVYAHGELLRNAGMVHQLHPDGSADAWTQLGEGVAGYPETGDRFGSAVAEAPTDDYVATLCDGVPCEVQHFVVLISIVGEDEGRGAVIVDFSRSFKRISKPGQPGDRFGASLAPTM